jgi:hypothetical protein
MAAKATALMVCDLEAGTRICPDNKEWDDLSFNRNEFR